MPRVLAICSHKSIAVSKNCNRCGLKREKFELHFFCV